MQKVESLPLEASSRLEQKRAATRARVQKHRARNKTTLTKGSPLMSNTERSHKRYIKKKTPRIDSLAVYQGIDQFQPNWTEREVPDSCLERTRQYHLPHRCRTSYIKRNLLTKSAYNYRLYAKQKQL